MIVYDNGDTRPTTHIAIGFLVATLRIEIRGHNNKLTGLPGEATCWKGDK